MSVKIVWEDHLPKHVHVISGSNKIRVTFDGITLSGHLEPDKHKKLKDWLIKRQTELNDRWEKAIRKEPFERIEP